MTDGIHRRFGMDDLMQIPRKRLFRLLLVAALFSPAGMGTAFADSSTIRIEHGNAYGAIVTREAGVTVFRALPPTKRVIVNPGGQTPLSFSLNEMQVTEQTTVNNNFAAPLLPNWSQSRYRRY